MNDIAAALALDAIATHRRERTAAALELLDAGHTPPPGDKALPLAYALAYHRLEGAENAARHSDTTALDWYRNTAGFSLTRLVRTSRLGPRIVVAPNEDEMIRGPHSDTPYYVLGPDTTRAAEPLAALTDEAFDQIAATGLDALVEAHATVICLTGRRRPYQTLRSFAITRLPATVFTDHTGDGAVLGRDLVHEAAHNWLNDALAALRVTFPDEETYFSPWRGTERPAYGFVHACFAFPLTMIYAARILADSSGPEHAALADHVHQQRAQLAAAQDGFTRALKLVTDHGLRERLGTVFQHARSL
ncbi:HEXXH motif-containing putative peptide modification protein [Streptomyces sp. NPDC001231]|uniref:aKG-HExxH-type peptide beta-hydroxylase n=1 Tax=Streptomyces sp. NPDC001231 TaxID=3364549 RepID=UPI0036C6843A